MQWYFSHIWKVDFFFFSNVASLKGCYEQMIIVDTFTCYRACVSRL